MTNSKVPGDTRLSEPTTGRVKRRKRRRHLRDEHVGYLVRVSGWHFYYSFHVSDPQSRWDAGPYSQIATLSFTGDIVRPNDTKYKQAKITLSAKPGLMEENQPEPPRLVGRLSANADELSAYVSVPAECMAELASVAQSGRVQIIHISAARLRYRSALVHGIALDTEFREEDW